MTTAECIHSQRLAALRERWETLLFLCKARREMQMIAFEHLVTAYSEPHRHYHNLEHICEMLDLLIPGPFTGGGLGSPTGQDVEMNNVELAAWFHDLVYDPRSSDNECRSADVARRIMLNLGLSESRIVRVCDLILMTKDHQAPRDDFFAEFFLDVDLGILGTCAERYAEYVRAIRLEYAHIADRDFFIARRSIMKGLLARSSIYLDPEIHLRLESLARANIAAEIAHIDEILRTLPS